MGTPRAGRIGIGPGPVFVYEWITASRRWQGYAIRSLFVAILLVAVATVWQQQGRYGPLDSRQALAALGQQFYLVVMGTQLTLVLLAAPAATAGAICLDRARGTLAHLLVTDLTDSEIVLGKLGSRLVPVLWLVACALPLLALLTLLGGVDPEALFAGFLVTAATAVLGCSLALAFSLWVGKTHEALLGTYAVWGLWLLGPMMVPYVAGFFDIPLSLDLRALNPFFLTFAPYTSPGRTGLGDYANFIGTLLGISAVLVALAVWRLRSVSDREPRRSSGRSRLDRLAAAGSRLKAVATAKLPGPSLDHNPVLWREWHRNRPSRVTALVVALYIGISALFTLIAISTNPWGGDFGSVVNAFQVSIGLLLLSVSSATALAEERVRGSLDVLMATPLTTREIVLGKWLGTYRLVPWLAILPTIVLAFDRRPQFSFLMTAYVLAQGAFVTSLGLTLATWTSRLGRAVGGVVTAFVAITVGGMFLVMAFFSPNPLGYGLITGSAFYGPIVISMLGHQRNGRDIQAEAVFAWVLLYATVSAMLLFWVMRTFNSYLGRVENGLLPARTTMPHAGPVVARREDLVVEGTVGE